ncbi:MAG: isopentenyl phosphate kinase family protein [Candidatus Altiarchaeota archaeon]|nr:isopentenyl phosphate kinase family protein [Candidatus Altiarchaeota archaeon]
MKSSPGLVIVKLGGSAITRKDDGKADVNRDNLERLAKEIANARNGKGFPLIVVHGAGPFGHVPAKKYRLDKGITEAAQIEGIAITHSSMEELNTIVVDELRKNRIPAISFQPSAGGILRDGRLVKFPADVMEKMLDTGLVPVSYGDVLCDENKGVGILSGDHLVPYLAKKLEAQKVVLVADVAGIFDRDPKKNRKAKLLKEVDRKNAGEILEIGAGKGVDVTGGMERKLGELLELADEGIESEVINGFKPGLLEKALKGEKVPGTIIKKNTKG